MERKKIKFFGGLALLSTALAINYFTHFGSAVRAGLKATDFPIYPITQEVRTLMDYQKKCFDECFSAWVFVPGSVMWRYNKFPEVGDPSRHLPPDKPLKKDVLVI